MSERSRQAIRLALRVLIEVDERRSCDPEDAIALRRMAGNLQTFGMPLDELACLVIQRERQASMRGQG